MPGADLCSDFSNGAGLATGVSSVSPLPGWSSPSPWPGEDSEFFALERRLSKAGYARQNDETTAEWLARVSAEVPAAAESLRNIVRLHQKYRFGCAEIELTERELLRNSVRQCLAQV
jgi:hypothetical protein